MCTLCVVTSWRARAEACTLPAGVSVDGQGVDRAAMLNKAHVLLVDDDEYGLRATARTLKALGYSVITASDGDEALKQFEHTTFEVVLSDIAMPTCDGVELLRRIREKDLDVPVVLITGDPSIRTAVKALEYGAFHYITKPCPFEQLRDVLQRAVQVQRLAVAKREAAETLGLPASTDRAGLEATLAGITVVIVDALVVGRAIFFGVRAVRVLLVIWPV